MSLSPTTLEGRYIRLEPLARHHLPGLIVAGAHRDIWRWLPSYHDTPEKMAAWVEESLVQQDEAAEAARPAEPGAPRRPLHGSEPRGALVFVMIDRKSEAPIGSSRYFNADLAHRRLEIGWTWITPAFQRTAANTESKYLLMRHAFESLGCQRVEFKTDVNNHRSRVAVVKIGAVEEGTFRNHMVRSDGSARDSVFFSVIAQEWPEVRRRLEAKLYTTVSR